MGKPPSDERRFDPAAGEPILGAARRQIALYGTGTKVKQT
jgi:hypothetical protein